MILVSELKLYMEQVKAALPQVNTAHVLINEPEVTAYLADMKTSDNQLMLVIMPDARAKAKNEDSIVMNNAISFFFLEKTQYSSSKKDEWIAIFERTQESAVAFMRKLINDKTWGSCGFNRHLDVNNISIEPVSGMASCNGWVVEVYFDTPF